MTDKDLKPSEGGSRYKFFKVLRIPNQAHTGTYLWRLRIIDTPQLGLYLHKFHEPDTQDIHNHPFDFWSFVLSGGYTEEIVSINPMRSGLRKRRAGRWHSMSSVDYHKVRLLHKTPTWTIIFRGKRRQRWGYLVNGEHVDYEEISPISMYK